MILVSLNCLLINIDEIITSSAPYSKHFFPMSIMRFEMSFASILLIVLCVISFDPTWDYVRSIFFQDWSNEMVYHLLIVVPLKLFKCGFSLLIELLNTYLFCDTSWCWHMICYQEQLLSNFYSVC